MPKKYGERDKYYQWLDTPLADRQPPDWKTFMTEQGVTRPTLLKWDRERKLQPGVSENYDSISYLQNRMQAADIALLESCISGNASAQKVLRQILGQLADKPPETEEGLSADEHRRIRAEGQRRLQETVGVRAGGIGSLLNGVQGVHILPDEVCVDNQQEHSEED